MITSIKRKHVITTFFSYPVNDNRAQWCICDTHGSRSAHLRYVVHDHERQQAGAPTPHLYPIMSGFQPAHPRATTASAHDQIPAGARTPPLYPIMSGYQTAHLREVVSDHDRIIALLPRASEPMRFQSSSEWLYSVPLCRSYII